MSGDTGNYRVHQLEHYQQRYNWDCGVSCVLMVLPPEQRKELLSNFDQVCFEEGFKQSTWTIDLCYLLKRFGIKHCMYTTTLGVSESYKKHRYYVRIIDIDKDRVQRRFDETLTSGIEVQKHSLTYEELLTHLSTKGPVIVLVDAGLLVCDLCKYNKLKAEFRRCFGGSYRGHYIVLVGYKHNRLVYRDPALPSRLCATSPLKLHKARTASGTDHDIILIYREYR